MLSKPFVLQKLHLFFSWLVYQGCCSSRRLDRNNYAASKTSKKKTSKSNKNYFINDFFLYGKSEKRLDKYIYDCRCQRALLIPERAVIYACWAFQVSYSDFFFFFFSFGPGFHLFTAKIMQAESFTLGPEQSEQQNFSRGRPGMHLWRAKSEIISEICNMLNSIKSCEIYYLNSTVFSQ